MGGGKVSYGSEGSYIKKKRGGGGNEGFTSGGQALSPTIAVPSFEKRRRGCRRKKWAFRRTTPNGGVWGGGGSRGKKRMIWGGKWRASSRCRKNKLSASNSRMSLRKPQPETAKKQEGNVRGKKRDHTFEEWENVAFSKKKWKRRAGNQSG